MPKVYLVAGDVEAPDPPHEPPFAEPIPLPIARWSAATKGQGPVESELAARRVRAMLSPQSRERFNVMYKRFACDANQKLRGIAELLDMARDHCERFNHEHTYEKCQCPFCRNEARSAKMRADLDFAAITIERLSEAIIKASFPDPAEKLLDLIDAK